MKKLIILVAALSLGGGAFSQAKKMDTTMTMHRMGDCMMMKDGKMMMMKKEKMMEMDHDTTVNGTMVMKDCTVKLSSGKKMTLKEGDCVLMNGKIKRKMHKMMN